MIWELAGSAAVAGAISLVVCLLLIRRGPVDLPNEQRKAHQAPTPTSGGIGIGAGYAVGLLVLWRFAEQTTFNAQGAALAALASVFAIGFLVVGFIDDARHLGPRTKMFWFTLLSLGASITMGVVDALPVSPNHTVRLGFMLGLFGTSLWVFTLVNCANFMDGANGLSMGSMAVGLTALGAIGYAGGSNSTLAMCFCAAGALAGFLVFNFPKGRIFAGDSGALFVGAIAALGALVAIARAGVSPFIPPILFMPILADALLTLAWRVKHGHSLLVGHREHLYQIAMRAGWSHTRVSLLYWALMALCGVLGFALSHSDDPSHAWIALLAVAGLSLAASILVRKYARTHGMS
ncbi:MAG: hypothetical protein KJZ75_10315 [Hyphomonadaceae bacterium]|nr:hypothetical protein [Hyphomonadaceae bacterium]GIK50284.1 MAG: glycoside hydrolase [Alphaproteobacteria bacterium]